LGPRRASEAAVPERL